MTLVFVHVGITLYRGHNVGSNCAMNALLHQIVLLVFVAALTDVSMLVSDGHSSIWLPLTILSFTEKRKSKTLRLVRKK